MGRIRTIFQILCIVWLFIGCETNIDRSIEYALNGDGRFPVFTMFSVNVNDINYACEINNLEKINKSVLCIVPYGEPKNNLTFSFEVTEKAQMFIADKRRYSNESAYDFTNPVEAMLKDKGGEESYYTITVKNRPPNGVIPKVTAYSILLHGQEYKCFIDEEKKEITGSVPYGTDRSALVAVFQTTENPDITINGLDQISGLTENDYTESRKLILRDYEDEVNEYSVKISIAPNTEALIYSFSMTIDGMEYVSKVLSDSIITYLPYGTPRTNATLNYIVSNFATTTLQDIIIHNGDMVNMSNDQLLKVTAQDQGIPKNYNVIVKYLPNTATMISTFGLLAGSTYYDCTITGTNITVDVPFGTDIKNMIARFETSYGAGVSIGEAVQTSNVTLNNFSDNVIYTVTSESGTISQNYTITVNVQSNTEASITDFRLKTHTNGPDVETNCSISDAIILCKPPYDSDLTTGIVRFTASEKATVTVAGVPQQSEITVNDFSGGDLVYMVMAQDGQHSNEYVVKIEIACNPDVQSPTEDNVYGLDLGTGKLNMSNIQLTNSCGNPIPYTYGQLIDYSLYDNSTTGPLVTGKALRIMINNGLNVFNKNNFYKKGLNNYGAFKVRAMYLQDKLKVPQGQEVYLDPQTGKFVFPMPMYVHSFDKGETPDFNMPGNQTIRYTLLNHNFVKAEVGDNPTSNIYAKASQNQEDKAIAWVTFKPFGDGPVNLEKGTVSLHAGVTYLAQDTAFYNRYGRVTFRLNDIFHVQIMRSIKTKIVEVLPLTIQVEDVYTYRLYINENNLWYEKYNGTHSGDERLYFTWDFSPAAQTKFIRIYSAGFPVYETAFNQNYGTEHTVTVELEAATLLTGDYRPDTNYIKSSVSMLKIWQDNLPGDFLWVQGSGQKNALHPVFGYDNDYTIHNATAGFYYNPN